MTEEKIKLVIAKGSKARDDQGDLEEALKLFHKARYDFPNEPIILRELAKTLFLYETTKDFEPKEEDLEKILAIVDDAIEIEKNNPESWLIKADILLYLERDDAAIAAYDKVLELAPSNPLYWLSMGWALGGKDLKAQLECCRTALKLAPTDEEVLAEIGVFLENLLMTQAAAKFYQAALDNNPGSERAMDHLVGLNIEKQLEPPSNFDPLMATSTLLEILDRVEKFLS